MCEYNLSAGIVVVQASNIALSKFSVETIVRYLIQGHAVFSAGVLYNFRHWDLVVPIHSHMSQL